MHKTIITIGLAVLFLLGLIAGLFIGLAGALSMLTTDRAVNGAAVCVFFCIITGVGYSELSKE